MQKIVESYRFKTSEIFEIEAVPHLQTLKRLAMHLVRNKSEAEDLVQETYAQALKSFDRYTAGTNCRAWLCKIMFYKRSQWIRANSRFRQFDETKIRALPVAYAAMLPPDFMGEKITLALDALPGKFRQIVWLFEVEEYTYREIAFKIDVPIGTVMSRLHRGRKMLRDNFAHVSRPSSVQGSFN